MPIFKLQRWRDRALAGIDAGPKKPENDPVERWLDKADPRTGALVMEVEIVQEERRARSPGFPTSIFRSPSALAWSPRPWSTQATARSGRGCASCRASGFPVRASCA